MRRFMFRRLVAYQIPALRFYRCHDRRSVGLMRPIFSQYSVSNFSTNDDRLR